MAARDERRRFLFPPPQNLIHRAPENFSQRHEPRSLRLALSTFPFRDGGAFDAEAFHQFVLRPFSVLPVFPNLVHRFPREKE